MAFLPKNIQLIRGLLGMTQDEFAVSVLPGLQKIEKNAKEIKKLRSKISSYEKGVAQPPLAVQAKIARIGGVSLEDLSNKELSLSDINIKVKTENSEDTKNTDLDLEKMITLIRKEMTFIRATQKIHSLKIINIESKVMHRPFDEVFSDHEKKIAQEITRLEESPNMF